MAKRKTVFVDADILVIGGGFGGCGAAYESRFWGRDKKVVVVGADKMSSIVDYTDRQTCVIFGDGAGAVLLEPEKNPGLGILDSILKVDGAGGEYLKMIAGGSLNPATIQTVKSKHHYIFQDGKTVFKFAVTKMADVSEQIMQRNHLNGDDIDWLVPHQANERIIDSMQKKFGIDKNKIIKTVSQHANTSAASIPLALYEAVKEKKIRSGNLLAFEAIGGGLTWGASLVKYGRP